MLGELFDPKADFETSEHFRPHWSQAASIVFIRFRTQDSIPKAVVEHWEYEKREWLIQRGYTHHWSQALRQCLRPSGSNSANSSIDFARNRWMSAMVNAC